MKTELLILALTAFALTTFGQCPTAPCTNIVTFPISVNDFNNSTGVYQGFGPNRCIEGCGTFGFDLNLSSNAAFTSFNGTGTGIDIQQYWNMNTGSRGYMQGVNFIHHLNAAGGNDSVIIYCAENSQTECGIPQLNNSTNYVFLASGATWYMDGAYWEPGMTYQGQGNSTNVLHFVACGISAPLAIQFIEFKIKNDAVYYQTSQPAILQHSFDGIEFQNMVEFNALSGSQPIALSGYYRLLIGKEASNVIKYNPKPITPEVRLYFYEGYWYRERPNAPIVGSKKLNR
jgi:hypothetical protein